MKKWEKIIIIVGIATILILLTGIYVVRNFPEWRSWLEFKDIKEEEIYSCEKDEDCIKVIDGCCGCNEMGSNTAINRLYLTYWRWKSSKPCSGCLLAFSNHRTCKENVQPKCIDNRCQLVEVSQ